MLPYHKDKDLEDLEATLRDVLWSHQGKDEAISRAALCRAFQIKPENDRWLRRIIKHLVIKHGCPIGSCQQGYFWAVTPEEIEGVCRYYKSYALSSLQVVSRLKKISVGEVCRQLSFELQKE